MRYYSASALDLSRLSMVALGRRVEMFNKIHKQDVKFQAAINGAKLK